MDSMYDKLMRLPLFAGASHKSLSDIVGRYKFNFLKYSPGDVIVSAGEVCTHLMCIINGSVNFSVVNDTKRFKVSQTLVSPDVIAPDFFFGRVTRYPGQADAITETGVLQIEKNDYLNIIAGNSVFLFNYLNILSMNAQLAAQGVLALTGGSLEKRICYWIVALTQNNGRDITLECRHKDMYTVFGVQRQSLLAALDNLASQGIITYNQTAIHATDRRTLLAFLDENR